MIFIRILRSGKTRKFASHGQGLGAPGHDRPRRLRGEYEEFVLDTQTSPGLASRPAGGWGELSAVDVKGRNVPAVRPDRNLQDML